jgi:hypothetical protein
MENGSNEVKKHNYHVLRISQQIILQVSVHLSILNASQYSEGPQIMAKRS